MKADTAAIEELEDLLVGLRIAHDFLKRGNAAEAQKVIVAVGDRLTVLLESCRRNRL